MNSRPNENYAPERERLEKERAHYANVGLKRCWAAAATKSAMTLKTRSPRRTDGRIAENDYRTANIRAGYLYVISNVGSFGPGIVKIGLTRRLEPMDRVRELGDASVPFGFDVHAIAASRAPGSTE